MPPKKIIFHHADYGEEFGALWDASYRVPADMKGSATAWPPGFSDESESSEAEAQLG